MSMTAIRGFEAIIKPKTIPEADVIFDWLADNLVDGDYCYNGRDYRTRELSFTFINEQDLMMFLLR